MKYYRISDKKTAATVNIEVPVIYQQSHLLMETKTGSSLIDYTEKEDGETFVGPLICSLDDEMQSGFLPTIFMSPAFITTKKFYTDLTSLGLDNIEAHPVVIEDEVNNRKIENYLLLNIIGRISCAVLDKSEYEQLNDDADEDDSLESMYVIDELVIDPKKVKNQDLFLVHEDTDCIVISERIYNHLQSKGYTDIYFEEVEQI